MKQLAMKLQLYALSINTLLYSYYPGTVQKNYLTTHITATLTATINMFGTIPEDGVFYEWMHE